MRDRRCGATSFASPHEYESTSMKEIRALEADDFEVCRKVETHPIHDLAECDSGCGRRPAKTSAGGYCCKPCAKGKDRHTEQCDERNEP